MLAAAISSEFCCCCRGGRFASVLSGGGGREGDVRSGDEDSIPGARIALICVLGLCKVSAAAAEAVEGKLPPVPFRLLRGF